MFCGEVKEFLSQQKIEFLDRNIAADESALAELEKLGYMTTPVTLPRQIGESTSRWLFII
jgi:hypothetical protein